MSYFVLQNNLLVNHLASLLYGKSTSGITNKTITTTSLINQQTNLSIVLGFIIPAKDRPRGKKNQQVMMISLMNIV